MELGYWKRRFGPTYNYYWYTYFKPADKTNAKEESNSPETHSETAGESNPGSELTRVDTSIFGKTSTPENKDIQEDKEAQRAEYERLSKNNPQGGSYHVGVDHEFTGQPLENYEVYGPELNPKRKAALQLLGLTENASPSEAEIKHAFSEYAKTYHPDKCEDPQACTEAFYLGKAARNFLLGIDQEEDDTIYTGEPTYQIAGKDTAKEDKEAAARAKAEAEAAEAERQRQEQERLRRQLEEASAINETSQVGAQVKTLYAAGLVQSLSTQSTAAMSHHGTAMNSFHNTRMLANVQLEDLNTGEMLASAGEHTFNKELIQDGGLYSYGQIYGFKMNQGKVDNLAGFDANGYGLEVGVFKQLNSEWSAGLMIGIQKMSSSFKEAQGSIKASNLRMGPFASWNKDQWHFNTALTYGITDMDSKRRDPVFGQEYKASPKANEWTAYASLGYDINMDHVTTGLILTPNIEVLYINSSIDGFKEKGQGDKALKVDSQNRTHIITRTGLQASYLIPDSELPREFRFGVGYQKSMLDESPIKVGYVDQGSMQQLKTGSYGKDAIYYNAGYSVVLKDHQNLHLDYFGSTGKSSQSNALALTYEMKF
ncbi:autotransporter domain-containing protein [Endozoicomonas numazuensis]